MKIIFSLSAFSLLVAAGCNSENSRSTDQSVTTIDTILVPSQDPPYYPVMMVQQTTITLHADGKSDTVRKKLIDPYAESDTLKVKTESGNDSMIIVKRKN